MTFTENENTELKEIVVSDICKEVIAFLNTNGGILYIGIRNDGTVSGVDNPDQTILQINNMIRDSIRPDATMFIRYESKFASDKAFVAVTVQRGTDRPYYLSSKGLKPSGVYVRNGTATDPATDTAIRRMIKETDGDSFEEMRSLDQNLTFAALEEQFRKRNVPFDSTKLLSLGMTSRDKIYTNVALLLSDQCPCTIKAATFSGTDQSEFQDRHEYSGSLFRQMDELYAYLDLRNRTSASFNGLYRTDVRDYPEAVLREALMNSLVHRDYSFSASTLVSIYDDRIEFVSVGGLPIGISLDDIMLGLSVCRNPKLAAIFYRLQLIEAYGTGIPKIMNAYEGTGLKPKIEVTSNAFKITLPNTNHTSSQAAAMPTGHQSPEEGILSLLDRNGYIVRGDVDRLLGVSQATSSRIIKRMVTEGTISQEGSGKNTKYKRSR